MSSGVITGFGSVKLLGKEYGTCTPLVHRRWATGIAEPSQGRHGCDSEWFIVFDGCKGQRRLSHRKTWWKVPFKAFRVRMIVLSSWVKTVLINDDTVFDNNIPGEYIYVLTVGDLVEVNGFVKGKGLIIAMLIEKKNPPATCEVKGYRRKS